MTLDDVLILLSVPYLKLCRYLEALYYLLYFALKLSFFAFAVFFLCLRTGLFLVMAPSYFFD